MAVTTATRLDPAAIAAFYQRVVAPKVADIEARRQKAANSFWWRATIAVVINSALLTFFVTGWAIDVLRQFDVNAVQDVESLVHIMLLSVIGFATFASMPLIKYQRETKAALLADIIAIFPGFEYNAAHQFSPKLIKQSGIFPSFDVDRGGDLITGGYGTVGVISANVHLVSISTDSKGRKHESTRFRGPVYHLTFPRTFRGHTKIRTDGGWLGNKLGGLFADLERVTLEDPTFEGVFEVYSDDQVEARYILTTGFMELLLKVAARHKNKIEASFFDQSVLLKVEGQAARLEVKSPLRTVDWQSEVARFVDEFQDAFALADELKLNQRIGL